MSKFTTVVIPEEYKVSLGATFAYLDKLSISTNNNENKTTTTQSNSSQSQEGKEVGCSVCKTGRVCDHHTVRSKGLQ